MAELAKMLHFLKSGTEQTAKAYSTVDEAGENYVPLKIDGVACYAPIGVTDDAMATNGRVKKNGTEYAIKSQQSKPAYTEISYTVAGTHTFTVPSGVTRLRVAVCGGGGGAVGHKDLQQVASTSAPSGGDSSFGNLLTATGGKGGYIQGDPWNGQVTGGKGGTPNGNTGDSCDRYEGTYACLGGSGFLLSFEKTTVQQGSTGSYGEGGSLAYMGSTEQWSVSAGGGSGGYATNYVEVSPNTTYSISVGSAGSNKCLTAPYLQYHPKSGFVLIAYGGDI
ncbi:MAG: hypothetical protein IIX53_02015 [Phascolarctobacterium sp.]|nr:hypothetical protein [Phascolarctobacterium sp.]MBQ5672659.1 hypothetical protein [Phascolarctobacterium sp.]